MLAEGEGSARAEQGKDHRISDAAVDLIGERGYSDA